MANGVHVYRIYTVVAIEVQFRSPTENERRSNAKVSEIRMMYLAHHLMLRKSTTELT